MTKPQAVKEERKKLSERMEDWNDDYEIEVGVDTFRGWMEEIKALEAQADAAEKRPDLAKKFDELLLHLDGPKHHLGYGEDDSQDGPDCKVVLSFRQALEEAATPQLDALVEKIESGQVTQFKDFMGVVWFKRDDVLKILKEGRKK